MMNALLLVVALLLPALAHGQADYAREQRWAEEIVPAVVVGDALYLEASGRRFLGLYAAPANARAGVVIIHGLGVHPDWGLISPLRSDLADRGYATLSVQMPVLAADAPAERYEALFPQAAERIQSAVAFLRSRGMKKVALVGHSIGARMADYFLTHSADPGVDAWVAIGLTDYLRAEALKQPVLDIYGEGDMPGILANAEKRAATLRKVRGSAQIEVAGADHFFNGRESALVKHVKLFLDRALR